ncbi:MAG: type ISP restriction/modification enzyme, partial [Clostridia bacterium]
ENAEEFWKFVSKGCELRKLHLMESPELDKPLTSYPISGSNIVEKVLFKECNTGILPVSSPTSKECGTSVSCTMAKHLSEAWPVSGKVSIDISMSGFNPTIEDGGLKHRPTLGKVFINATQYFDNVPELAWNFYIGGYQPAQKLLKDRKSRTLSYDDIIHYQKIIIALKRTAEIMEGINDIRKF